MARRKLSDEERIARQKQSRRKWYERTKLKRQQYAKDYYSAHKEDKLRYRRNNLLYKYGLNAEQWEEKFNSQGRVCACCGSSDPVCEKGRWATDHDHKTGKTRDILCNGCNKGLGCFEDDPEKLLKAIAYLEKHKCA